MYVSTCAFVACLVFFSFFTLVVYCSAFLGCIMCGVCVDVLLCSTNELVMTFVNALKSLLFLLALSPHFICTEYAQMAIYM